MAKKKSKFDSPVGKIDIRGTLFNIYIYPKQLFNSRHSGISAYMTSEPPEIHFSEEDRTLATILHEVFHCYMKSCFIQAMSDVSTDDVEEIACEMFAHFGVQAMQNAQTIQIILNDTIKERK